MLALSQRRARGLLKASHVVLGADPLLEAAYSAGLLSAAASAVVLARWQHVAGASATCRCCARRLTAMRVDGATPVLLRLGGEAQLAACRRSVDLSPRRATCARQLQRDRGAAQAALQGCLGGSV